MKLKLKGIIKVTLFIAFLTIIGCNNVKNTIIAPEVVSSSMAQMYPGVSKIEWYKGNMGTWKADFKYSDIKTTIIFDSIGAFKLKIERVPFTETPENIHTYFNANSGLVKLEKVERFTNAVDLVFYKAKLKGSNTSYYFDIDGTFIHEATGNEDDMEMGMINDEATSTIATNNIPILDLPVDVLNFIAYSHTGYMIESASHKLLCGGIEAIEAKVIKQSEDRSLDYSASYIFTNDGKYIRTEQEIDLVEIPETVREQIATNFKDFTPKSKAVLLTFSKDDEAQYLVYFDQGGGVKEVIFKADGKVVCES